MNKDEPLFKPVFNQQWPILPDAILKRYSNRPYSNDLVTVEGKLNIRFSRVMKFFMPILKIFKVLVPYQGNDIPVTVNFRSTLDSKNIYFERTFYFPEKKPYRFKSYLQAVNANDVVEFVCLGLGWRMKFDYLDEKVRMQHNGYVCKIFGKLIPIPLRFLFGEIYAEEIATSDHSFCMLMKITHPLFKTLFEYSGEFVIVSSP